MAKNKSVPRFSAAELIRAASGGKRDVLSILLEPGKDYTRDEVQKQYDNFLKKGGKADVHGKLDDPK